jgi:hypothetical protein
LAVRRQARSSRALPTSTASLPTFVTCARPSEGLRLGPLEPKNRCLLNMLWITPSPRVPAVSRRDFGPDRTLATEGPADRGAWSPMRWRRWRRAVRPSCGLNADACPVAWPLPVRAAGPVGIAETTRIPQPNGATLLMCRSWSIQWMIASKN